MVSFLGSWRGRRLDISIYAGERLEMHLASNDLGAGAFFRIAPTERDQQTDVFTSGDGTFDLSDAEIGAAIPEGSRYWYGLWSGPANDQTLHAHGYVERKFSIAD